MPAISFCSWPSWPQNTDMFSDEDSAVWRASHQSPTVLSCRVAFPLPQAGVHLHFASFPCRTHPGNSEWWLDFVVLILTQLPSNVFHEIPKCFLKSQASWIWELAQTASTTHITSSEHLWLAVEDGLRLMISSTVSTFQHPRIPRVKCWKKLMFLSSTQYSRANVLYSQCK